MPGYLGGHGYLGCLSHWVTDITFSSDCDQTRILTLSFLVQRSLALRLGFSQSLHTESFVAGNEWSEVHVLFVF